MKPKTLSEKSEPAKMPALEVLGDLSRKLDDGRAEALADAIASAGKGNRGTVKELRNPWAS